MIGMMLAAMLTAQARTNAPPPPVISVNSPPPIVAVPSLPPYPIPRLHVPDVPAPRPFLVDTTVSAGDRTLFRDVLRVARGYEASYNQSSNQAPMVPCAGSSSYQSSERSSLRIQLSNYSDANDRLSVSVHWDRPLPPSAVCQPPGLRGVQLTNIIELKAGETVVLEGDAGLRVSLKRR